MLTDLTGRKIEYLRISLTDRCNLRCAYCMPKEAVRFVPHEDILSIEEILRIVKILSGLGLKKVRLTGGEPLVRKGVEILTKGLSEIPGIKKIAITTNGLLLEEKLPVLAEAGLGAVNISLDTLNEELFKEITLYHGQGGAKKIFDAALSALNYNLSVKMNCVPVKEFAGQDYVSLSGIAKDNPIDFRFIELMPIGCGKKFTAVKSAEILKELSECFGEAKELLHRGDDGPAVYYTFSGFKGRIGFISPISHKFCSECNRIRLTSEGFLKLCLHYDKGIDLKKMLRSGCSDEEIAEAVKKAVLSKPLEHTFGKTGEIPLEESRRMNQIGG